MKSALVIDDNRVAADILVNFLELLELEARPAYSPKAAFLAVRDSTPDVIFLDLSMPGLSGFEVLSYLRREPGVSHVPVIVVTSDDQPETAIRAQREGASSVIIKPVSVERLEESLRHAKILED
jgi:CheY-like chemotaxis protein